MVEQCRVHYNALRMSNLLKSRPRADRSIDPLVMFLINTPQ